MLRTGDFSQLGQVSIRTFVVLYRWRGAHGCMSGGPYHEFHLFWREPEIRAKQLKNIVIEAQIPIAPVDAPQ